MRAMGTKCKCVLGKECIYDLQENAKDQNNVSLFFVQINVNISNMPHYLIPNESFEGRSLNSQTFRGEKNYRNFFLLTISIPDQCITSWTVLFFMSLTHSKANALQKCDNNVSNYFSHSLCCSKCISRSWNPSRKKILFIVTWRQMNFEVCTLPK